VSVCGPRLSLRFISNYLHMMWRPLYTFWVCSPRVLVAALVLCKSQRSDEQCLTVSPQSFLLQTRKNVSRINSSSMCIVTTGQCVDYSPPPIDTSYELTNHEILSTKLVVNRYMEDVRWLNYLPELAAVVYDKGGSSDLLPKPRRNLQIIKVDNTGREDGGMLRYIINNYDSLDNLTVFLQGWPFDHCPGLMSSARSSVRKALAPFISHDTPSGLWPVTTTFYQYSLPDAQVGLMVSIFEGLYGPGVRENATKVYRQFCEQVVGGECPPNQWVAYGAQWAVTKDRIRKKPKSFYENSIALGEGFESKLRGLVLEALWPVIWGADGWTPPEAKQRQIDLDMFTEELDGLEEEDIEDGEFLDTELDVGSDVSVANHRTHRWFNLSVLKGVVINDLDNAKMTRTELAAISDNRKNLKNKLRTLQMQGCYQSCKNKLLDQIQIKLDAKIRHYNGRLHESPQRRRIGLNFYRSKLQSAKEKIDALQNFPDQASVDLLLQEFERPKGSIFSDKPCTATRKSKICKKRVRQFIKILTLLREGEASEQQYLQKELDNMLQVGSGLQQSMVKKHSFLARKQTVSERKIAKLANRTRLLSARLTAHGVSQDMVTASGDFCRQKRHSRLVSCQGRIGYCELQWKSAVTAGPASRDYLAQRRHFDIQHIPINETGAFDSRWRMAAKLRLPLLWGAPRLAEANAAGFLEVASDSQGSTFDFENVPTSDFMKFDMSSTSAIYISSQTKENKKSFLQCAAPQSFATLIPKPLAWKVVSFGTSGFVKLMTLTKPHLLLARVPHQTRFQCVPEEAAMSIQDTVFDIQVRPLSALM